MHNGNTNGKEEINVLKRLLRNTDNKRIHGINSSYITASSKLHKLVMILDNSKIHHAKLLQEFLDKNKTWISLVFIPPYSPKIQSEMTKLFYKTVI